MNATKISDLINRENDRREEDAAERAQKIIITITNELANIAISNKRIEALRAELKALEVEAVDAKAILGE